jgi:hypothetical protein
MDSTGKMVICCAALLHAHAVYGGTLARWMTPGLGFCRLVPSSFKCEGKEGPRDLGHFCLRRLENMNLLTCETLQQRLQTIWSYLGLGHDGRATAPFHGINPHLL